MILRNGVEYSGDFLVSSSMYGKINDTEFRVPRVDSFSHSIQIIGYEHYEIHNGDHYFINGAEDLAVNDVLDFTFQTPDTTKWIHLNWTLRTENQTAWYVYETAVITNPLANALTAFNNNRNSTNTSGVTLKYELQADLTVANADTDVSTATLIESGISGAGRSAGNIKRSAEIVLKQNTIYCLRAVSTVAGYIDFNMEWYEHTNRA